MATRRRIDSELVSAAGGWSEGDLDRVRLPHPLLGTLTVREMLLFALYHGLHHVNSVARRKGMAQADA